MSAVRPAAGFDCVDQNNSASGKINSTDQLLVAQAFGQTAGRPNFALRDIDTDGVVGQSDLDRLTPWFNRNCATSVYRYTYDGNGTLLKRTLQQNGSTTSTVYIGGAYEKNSDGAVVKYYGALGRTIAMRQVLAGGGAGTLYYLLTDHLGSASTITNLSGAVVSSQKYWPYGATRSGSITQTDKQYTGQQIEPGDSALGLYNYKARFYSTVLGRFVSADSAFPVASSMPLNRLAYADDNPLRFNDPSGHDPTQQDRDNCAARPADCILWSVGGNWNRYYIAVGRLFGIDPAVLKAIVENEQRHYDREDFLVDSATEMAILMGLEGTGILNRRSVGPAQVQMGNASRLEQLRLVPKSDGAMERFKRLKTLQWGIYYAAALLNDLNNGVLAKYGYKDDPAALIVGYLVGASDLESAARAYDGCLICGRKGQEQLQHNVGMAEVEKAREELAVDLRE